ncbi:hypothetical protein SAMN05192533_10677 [Mesobacillus persicus]|uniref:YprB ribonuclease H-like domain-containing protein n=1 Tax=Mesobacillus persicus TaxID=930146 RepID=A0A1H8BKU8_9BACI|nr:ribonuclease H-like domain-containing protein [Mesobacillus persicus]SEM83423.1 hypothetical protein SAMN05192533_10677 [Mesobacillus persicus]
MSLKNKLNRLKPHLSIGVPSGEKQEATQVKVSSDFINQEIPFMEVWEKENVRPYFFDNDYCLVREVVYPLTYKHGNYRFEDAAKAVKLWNEKGVHHPLSTAGHSPGDMFFFDTETTGLGGGAGNTIFLLGHARLGVDSVTLKQHILPHPGAEVALYQSFLETIDYSTLVTYNGKAFDWPQVKTRHTLVRNHVPKLPSFGHFDLYHASRRMWKHKIERMKLSFVEKDILGFERKDDIPGFLAPMIYFDFLERKNPEGLLGVIKHNELDILSLISLYTHLSYQLLGEDKNRSVREAFEVGRWFSYLGNGEKAEETYASIAKGNEVDAINAKHALAFEHKRGQNFTEAICLWEETSEAGSLKVRIEACIELAKFHEHKSKNWQAALHYSQKAIAELEPLDSENKRDRWMKELHQRVNRLVSKMERKK